MTSLLFDGTHGLFGSRGTPPPLEALVSSSLEDEGLLRPLTDPRAIAAVERLWAAGGIGQHRLRLLVPPRYVLLRPLRATAAVAPFPDPWAVAKALYPDLDEKIPTAKRPSDSELLEAVFYAIQEAGDRARQPKVITTAGLTP